MKTGIVLNSNDPETAWNAFRFGNFALAMGDEVRVFLLGSGVEIDHLVGGEFDTGEQVRTLLATGGKIWACRVCLERRKITPSANYAVASMKDMYETVKESDKVVSF